MSSQTKISKQYIGDDQVGSSQIQLENNSSLRSKDSSDVNVDLMKLDSSNQLQILVQPFLPGDASSALQAVPKQQLDAVESALQTDINAAQADATQALSDAAAAQADATQALSDAAAAQADATQALSDAAAAQADVDALEPQVSTLQSEMDIVQEQNSVLEAQAYNSFASVYADGQPGILDPKSTTNPRPGWYFQNDVAGEKINWYFFDGASQATIQLQNFSAYAIMSFDSVSPLRAPILSVYTFPTGSGDIMPGFAHSKLAYSAPMSITPVVGKQYLVYFGQNPAAHPELPRIELSYVAAQSGGDQGPTEIVLTSSFGSDSGASVDTVQFMVEKLGVNSPSFRGEANLEIRPVFRELDGSVNMLAAKISNLADPTLAQDAATKAYTDTQLALKANTNLSNLVAVTAIPSTVTDLQSENISQVFASEFKINTKSQTTSVSGSIRMLSGDVSGAFASGGGRVGSGLNSNASMPSATSLATGLVSIVSGAVSGGTQGSSGPATISSGSVSSSSVTGNTGAITARSGNNSGIGLTGQVLVESGFSLNATGGRSGAMFFGSGKSGAAVSGDVLIYTGSINNSLGFNNSSNTSATGQIAIESGLSVSSGATGAVILRSGANSGSGNSGDVTIASGTVVSGTRGKISMSASIVEVNTQIDMQSNKIIDLLDPTSAQDAATKAYVDAQIVSGTNFVKQVITLSATDISNQYVDLSTEHLADSTIIGVGQRVNLYETLDYSLSVVGGVTRVSFIGPSASGGAEELVEGQVLYVQGVEA